MVGLPQYYPHVPVCLLRGAGVGVGVEPGGLARGGGVGTLLGSEGSSDLLSAVPPQTTLEVASGGGWWWGCCL